MQHVLTRSNIFEDSNIIAKQYNMSPIINLIKLGYYEPDYEDSKLKVLNILNF